MIHLSQPALSLQIRALEDEIGVRLLERNRRKTALTPAGVAFREDATGALLRLDQAVHKAKLAANGKLGILRIGFISTAGNEIVPTIIRQFRELNAKVEFSLRNVLTTDQIQMLEAGSLDIGFLRPPIGEGSGKDCSDCGWHSISKRSHWRAWAFRTGGAKRTAGREGKARRCAARIRLHRRKPIVA
jgi:DNA-binding transcriptional LysR family regulator